MKESLDLCLACKGCKGDCPVNVDMATYKAEFLSHYYKGRLRPMSSYTMGLIYWWARLACRAPAVANFLTQAPVLSDIAKIAIGVAPQRRLPIFASTTFKQWFRQRGPRNTVHCRNSPCWQHRSYAPECPPVVMGEEKSEVKI